MDGSENLAEASENLTSTTMGSVLVRNTKDSENTVNDSLPSSSSDANTAAAAVVTQDDPISSTSEEICTFKKPFIDQQSDSIDIAMDPETAQIAKHLSISNTKEESQTNNFEDIASELENLLEESAGDYKYSSKTSRRNVNFVVAKDINLDWDIDCEFSSKNSKIDTELIIKKTVCDNQSTTSSDKLNLETPSSSAEIVEAPIKFDANNAQLSSEIIVPDANSDIVENDPVNDNGNVCVTENESVMDNMRAVNSSDSQIESKVSDSQENKVPVMQIIDVDIKKYKEIVEILTSDASVTNDSLESPLQEDSNKEDADTINGALESIHNLKCANMEKDFQIGNDIVPQNIQNIQISGARMPLKTENIHVLPFESECLEMNSILKKSEEPDAELTEPNQITSDVDRIIVTSEPLTQASKSAEENTPNLNTTISTSDTLDTQTLDSDSLPSSALKMISEIESEKSTVSSKSTEDGIFTVSIESASGACLSTSTVEVETEQVATLVEAEVSDIITTETSSEVELENAESITQQTSTSVEMETNSTETFVEENVSEVADIDSRNNEVVSTLSTMSVDSLAESDVAEQATSAETESSLPTTETASDSSALILTTINTQERNLHADAVMLEYVEPSDQPRYEGGIYQSQDIVQDDESYSQEQPFDSYEEQEEDTLESALIKAAVDAEHTRREITAKKEKEKEEEQAKLRQQAELMRVQREKVRLEAEKARQLLEEEEQRERDLLSRQIEEQQKLKEEKRLAEEKLLEETKLVEEKKLLEEQKLMKRIRLEEKNEAETTAIVVELPASDETAKLEKVVSVLEIEIVKTVTEIDPERATVMKPLNIEVEESRKSSDRKVESTTKDGNVSEQPSESEDDNKPEYSSKMSSQESLKMTITKNKTDEVDNILKVYDPNEEEQSVRKIKIKPILEENVPKITFKNLHEKIPHSPKRSLRNLSPNRPQSPKVTIKQVKQENLSPLKITLKNVGRKSDETDEPQQNSPKITIKPIINPDEENVLLAKGKNILKDEEDKLHSPKGVYKNDSDRSSSPKVTIKPVLKPSDITESIPKLNIRLNKREQSPKHLSKNTKSREEENVVEPLKLNIKQYTKDPSSISPKITIKPVVRPTQEPVHVFDEEPTMQERIVLKINKSNYLVDSPQVRKRDAPEDIEKLAKIKLKVSKKPGHAHIINEEMEALKRSLPEGIELVDIKKPKLNIPTHTQGGATITPIILEEPSSQHEELSSDSVIFIGEGDNALSGRDELFVTPVKSSIVVTPITTPPKRRGRPRKVPLEPRDVPIEEPPISTSSDNLLMVTSNPIMSLLDGGHFLLSPTDNVSGGASLSPELIVPTGRPKRSCRGPSAHTQLGIKPRKPRGAGRARGGRGRGHRGGLRGGGVEKSGKFERISEPKLKLLKEAALSMKITDAFDRQDIAIRIVDSVQEQCSIPTTGRRRGGGHNDDSDDYDDGGTIISGCGGLEIIPRYNTLQMDEVMAINMGSDDRMPIKHGSLEKGRIGFLASGVIDITADDSLPPPEDEDDDDEMTGVEEVISSSSPPLSCNLDRQLKIVIGRNDQIGQELIMNKDIVIYEEETRMSANNGSRSGTPGKQESPAIDPLADIVDMAMPCEDTQSSVQSSATTESAKVVGGTDVTTSKATTRRTICRSDLSQDIDALVAITSPEQLAEYHWQGDGPFMLQEQIAEYLGVKSFKRKYPHITRRAVDMQERDYIRDNGLASEAMCNLGLTVLNSADVLDIMYSDFQMKYEEYCKHRRDKEAKEIMNRQRAINLAASQEKTKQDLVQTAIASAAQWNARFNRTRREQRPACMDLQTFTINYARGNRKVISRGRMGHYPLALVPGQFTDYYQAYTPAEINNLPFNTILPTPISSAGDDGDSGSESDSSAGSDSGSDSSSGSSGSSSSSSSDEEDGAVIGKGQTSPLNARSPIAAPTGKRLLAAA